MKKYFFALAIVFLTIASLQAESAQAQRRRGGDVGLGFQLGVPAGVTMRIYSGSRMSYDFLAAWDLKDYFYLNFHFVKEQRLESSPLNWYYGPGVFVGAEQEGRRNDGFFGFSGLIGINHFFGPLGMFLQFSPQIELVPSTDVHMHGGFGARYYF